MNFQQPQFKRSVLATLTALYVALPAAAAPGTTPVAGTTFHIPTFTAEDVKAFNDERAALADGDIYIGGRGLTNRQVAYRQADAVFVAQDGVTGVQKYVVQLSEQPVATYDGDITGLASTRSSGPNLVNQ